MKMSQKTQPLHSKNPLLVPCFVLVDYIFLSALVVLWFFLKFTDYMPGVKQQGFWCRDVSLSLPYEEDRILSENEMVIICSVTPVVVVSWNLNIRPFYVCMLILLKPSLSAIYGGSVYLLPCIMTALTDVCLSLFLDLSSVVCSYVIVSMSVLIFCSRYLCFFAWVNIVFAYLFRGGEGLSFFLHFFASFQVHVIIYFPVYPSIRPSNHSSIHPSTVSFIFIRLSISPSNCLYSCLH